MCRFKVVSHERELSSQTQFLPASTHGLLPSLTGQFPMVFYKTVGYSPFMCKQLLSSYIVLVELSLVYSMEVIKKTLGYKVLIYSLVTRWLVFCFRE